MTTLALVGILKFSFRIIFMKFRTIWKFIFKKIRKIDFFIRPFQSDFDPLCSSHLNNSQSNNFLYRLITIRSFPIQINSRPITCNPINLHPYHFTTELVLIWSVSILVVYYDYSLKRSLTTSVIQSINIVAIAW